MTQIKPHVFRQDLPLGPGIAFAKEGNKFKPKSMHEYGCKTSLAAIQWLEYENRQYLHMPIAAQIQHAFNGRGEKKIGKYHLDGYVEWENENEHVWIGYEFMGCRFHQCPFNCGTHCLQTDEEYETEQVRLNFLRRNLTRMVIIYGCEWEKRKLAIRAKEKREGTQFSQLSVSRISQFLSQPSVTESEILDALANDKFYGIICLDICTPEDVIEKYKHLNFPFIFNSLEITEDLLSPETLEMANARKINFPFSAKTLTWNAKKFIGCTPLLRFYLSLGMKLSNIRWALEYQRGAPFKDFVNLMVDERVQAAEEEVPNQPRGDRAKFVLNSAVAKG